MTDGPFRLTGYVASAGAETSCGESLGLTCGLIGVYVVNGPGTSLRVQLTPLGEARIWWAEDEVGCQLESSLALGAVADWQPVSPAPVGNEHFTPAWGPARFFRLKRF
jgi:hypothetical protein